MKRLVARANSRDLDLHRDLARALDLAVLQRARVLALDLARDLDRARALIGDRALIRAFTHAFTHDLDRALDLHHAPNLDRNLALALDLALAHDLDLALIHAHTLDLARASDRVLARAHARDRDRAHALADTLARARDIARALVDLNCASRGAGAAIAGGARSMPGRVSRGLVALAVRMLPAAQRPRYRAEFRVELVELPRQERWGYALRVLASAWGLRRALVEAVRTTDGATARRAER